MLQTAYHDITPDAQEAIARQLPLMEPEIIPCLFVTGSSIETADTTVRLVSWVEVSGDSNDGERRLVSRIAMSNTQARRLLVQLKRALERGGH